jgi:hypothetical protein
VQVLGFDKNLRGIKTGVSASPMPTLFRKQPVQPLPEREQLEKMRRVANLSEI